MGWWLVEEGACSGFAKGRLFSWEGSTGYDDELQTTAPIRNHSVRSFLPGNSCKEAGSEKKKHPVLFLSPFFKIKATKVKKQK